MCKVKPLIEKKVKAAKVENVQTICEMGDSEFSQEEPSRPIFSGIAFSVLGTGFGAVFVVVVVVDCGLISKSQNIDRRKLEILDELRDSLNSGLVKRIAGMRESFGERRTLYNPEKRERLEREVLKYFTKNMAN